MDELYTVIYAIINTAVLFIITFPFSIVSSRYVPPKPLFITNIITAIAAGGMVLFALVWTPIEISEVFICLMIFVPNLALYIGCRKKAEKKKYSFKQHMITTAIIAGCHSITMCAFVLRCAIIL